MISFDQLIAWIQTHPALFAATVGMILSSSYLVLMLVTKLGDIKPGIQSFVLSAVIHVVMASFWGNLAIPGNRNAKGRALVSTPIPIRQVIVEGTDLQGNSEYGDSQDVWDQLSGSKQVQIARAEAKPFEAAPLEAPDRAREVIESPKGILPELPKPVEVAEAAPQPVAVALAAPARSAAEQVVDIGEETSESRPDAVTSAAPARGGSNRAEATSTDIQRGTGTDPAERTNVAVQMSAQPGISDNLEDSASPERKQTEVAMTPRKTGPVRVGVDIEDVGTPEGASTGTAAEGPPATSKFTRVGQPQTGNRATNRTPVGTVERSGTPAGTAAPGVAIRAPQIASLGTGEMRAALSPGERPGISSPNFNAIPSRGSAVAPDTYRLRTLPQRQKVAVRLGATQDSERAVETSLRWLALHQTLEGYWDADGFDANCPPSDKCKGKGGRGNLSETEKINNPVDRIALQTAGKQADTGLTALVVLTFLGAGYTHEEGQYADQIDRAIRWLIRQQEPNGFLGGDSSHYERMYCHGMATYALGEACGMMADPESDPRLRRALNKAVQYIVAMQNPSDGGWRYLDGKLAKQEGDMSMFGWQLMALKSSQIAGIEVPQETQQGMVRFLKRISLGERRGLASYRFGEAPKASMTAEALFSRQMLGMKRDNPSSVEAVEYLMKHPPHQTEQDLYYWYYGTLAMYQYGGEPWRRWNDQLRDTLVETQRKTGHAAGSWDPRDNWSMHGGRLYSTALSTLCLEVYYRFLPLYQLNGTGMDSMEN